MEDVLGIGLDLSEEELHEVLLVYADTSPYIDVVEDIEMFLAGYNKKLKPRTLEEFQKDKDLIPNILEFIRMDE